MRERHEAHVVVIERVRRGSVRQRRARGTRAGGSAEHLADASTFAGHDALHNPARRFTRSGENDTNGVEHGRSRASTSLSRRRRADHEFTQLFRNRHVFGYLVMISDYLVTSPGIDAPDVPLSGLPIAAMKRCLMNTQS